MVDSAAYPKRVVPSTVKTRGWIIWLLGFLGYVALYIVRPLCKTPQGAQTGMACAAGMLLPPFGFIFIGGMAFGVYLFFKGFVTLQRKRFVENIPTSKIESIAPGIVEVYGKVSPYEDDSNGGRACLIKYFQGCVDCVYYETLLTIIRVATSVPFYVSDRTGKVLVEPKGAVVSVALRPDFSESYPKKFIKPGDTVYVIGSAVRNPYAKQSAKNVGSLMIGCSKNDGNLLFISDIHESEILSRLSKKSLAMALCGPVLFLANFAVWLNTSLTITSPSFDPLLLGGLTVFDFVIFAAWMVWKTESGRFHRKPNSSSN